MSYIVLGAGLMGRALVHDLIVNSGMGKGGDDGVTSADIDAGRLGILEEAYGKKGLKVVRMDAGPGGRGVSELLTKGDVLVNATTYRLNVELTRQAISKGCNMLDLGGNMDVVRAQLAQAGEAKKAGVTVLANCGLAPGMANVVAAWMLKGFERPKSLKIFVGGLPLEPKPPLNYMQLFSMEGLINEYIEPADVIAKGSPAKVQSLSGLEPVIFPEPFGTLEAFHTSGGISMMVDDGSGKVETMYYKTLRYPGHCNIFKALQEMGMMDHGPVKVEGRDICPRKVLEASLARTLPKEGPDATLMRIEATGTGTRTGAEAGKERTRIIQMVDKPDRATGLSSMMRATAFPTSIMAQMVHDGVLKTKGVFTPERVVDGEALISALREKGRNVMLENVRE